MDIEDEENDKAKVYFGIKSFPKHAANPFVEKAINDIQITKRTKIERSTNKSAIQSVVNQDGEVTGHTAFMRFIEVDEERFTKIYLSQLGALWDLNKAALRVFTYIQTKLMPDKDEFIFMINEAMEYTKYKTKKQIFSGLGQLIDAGIVARSERSWAFYINPLVIFNGNRVTFSKTYVKKKKAEDPAQLDLFKVEAKSISNSKLKGMKLNDPEAIKKLAESKEEDFENYTGKEEPTYIAREKVSKAKYRQLMDQLRDQADHEFD